MKKIVLILFLGITTFAYGQSQKQTTNHFTHKKNKLYEEHKKQLIEQNKIYEEEKRKNNTTSDSIKINDTETVDFSTGKPVKK